MCLLKHQLTNFIAAVAKDIKSSDYIGLRFDEALSRTVLDLILIDRLRRLEDKDAYHQLLLSAEVPVAVRVKDIEVDGGDELIKGRADWVLGYGRDKASTGSILVVVEAKPVQKASVGLPQLLVYMAGVHEARKGKANRSVFGMLSDSVEFRFAFLNEDKKLHLSRPLLWSYDAPSILAYIDTILLDAIHSSPLTTPNKARNDTLLRYPQYLREQWSFGEQEEEDDTEVAEGDVVDVVRTERGITLRTLNREL